MSVWRVVCWVVGHRAAPVVEMDYFAYHGRRECQRCGSVYVEHSA